MITHKVVDMVFSELENNVVMNGSLKECEDFIASQETDYFTYEIRPLLREEKEFLNSYHLALTQGRNYEKNGRFY